MATIISQLKGTATEIAAKVLGNGVLAWNETTKRWHGGDGATAGGFAMAREDEKNDGALGYLQEVKTNDYAVGVGDIGKALVANKATAITFTLRSAATLTSKFVAIIKNIGSGTLSLAPTGAELIDGVNAAVSIATNSSLIIKGDGSSFRTYVSNGDVTASAIYNATGKTPLADNDELGVIDSAASNVLKKVLFSNLIASIFTTARKIANAYFTSSFRLWDATDNTKGLAFDLSGIATATTRALKMANRDTDLAKVGWELLAETIVSTAVPTVDFVNVLSSAFDEYFIELTDVAPSAAANGELVDMSAGEVADFEASRAVDLPAMKDMLKARVDAAAESERLKYITPGAGQALTYAQKADQARAYLEAVSPVDEDYPLLSAEIGVTGATAAEVANVIRASFTAWQQIGSQIEATRLRAKKAIEGASDAESAIEAASNLTWLS